MDLTTLTDEDLDALRVAVLTEQERRATLANAPAQVEQISRAWADASGRHDGDPWQQPAGGHDVWATDSVCQWPADTWWQATSPAAHEPGTTGAPWVRVWPDGAGGWTRTTPAETGPLPWAVGINAIAGETIVSHAGRLWSAKVTHNTHAGWEPSAATHAVWTDLGPSR